MFYKLIFYQLGLGAAPVELVCELICELESEFMVPFISWAKVKLAAKRTTPVNAKLSTNVFITSPLLILIRRSKNTNLPEN
jgi:hypothetical protein